MEGNFFVADYGQQFKGWVGLTAAGAIICIAPPNYETDPTTHAVMREMVERQGGDCAVCKGCPLGLIDR